MSGELIEQIITKGDISALSAGDRVQYYQQLCARLGLDPLLQPFQYLTLQGKQILYATKSATEQLRVINGISVVELHHSNTNGVYVVTCKVENAKGRIDCATGAVAIEGLKGDALANAVMKAETKAKRRATLSIAGLGMLDESEIETIPGAVAAPAARIEHTSALRVASRVEIPALAALKPAAKIEPVAEGGGARARILVCSVKTGVAKSTGRAWTQYLIDMVDDDTGAQVESFTWSESLYKDAQKAYEMGGIVEYEAKPGRTSRVELVSIVLLSSKNKMPLPENIPF